MKKNKTRKKEQIKENRSKRRFAIFLFFLTLLILVIYFNKKHEYIPLKEITEVESTQKIYLMGKFDPAQSEYFVLVPKQNTLDYSNKLYLRNETLNAYLQMAYAASKDDIDLKIVSATRTFFAQKNLWNKKWFASNITDKQKRFKNILKYTAAPGTSRHHFGTDIDINNTTNAYFKTKKGIAEYEWLKMNALKYGFCQIYNTKNDKNVASYGEEKWHWSYMPLAKTLSSEYRDLVKIEDIIGFEGYEYKSDKDFISDYVLNINPECYQI